MNFLFSFFPCPIISQYSYSFFPEIDIYHIINGIRIAQKLGGSIFLYSGWRFTIVLVVKPSSRNSIAIQIPVQRVIIVLHIV